MKNWIKKNVGYFRLALFLFGPALISTALYSVKPYSPIPVPTPILVVIALIPLLCIGLVILCTYIIHSDNEKNQENS